MLVNLQVNRVHADDTQDLFDVLHWLVSLCLFFILVQVLSQPLLLLDLLLGLLDDLWWHVPHVVVRVWISPPSLRDEPPWTIDALTVDYKDLHGEHDEHAEENSWLWLSAEEIVRVQTQIDWEK